MTTPLLLSIDQGTTSSRAMLFEKDGSTFAVAQREFTQYYPQSGWVEHNPEEIWKTTLTVCQEALAQAESANRKVAAIGITNQRETTLIWDRHTGKPIYNAIVWQDRRTAEHCRDLQQQGHTDTVTSKTGLLLDPYFSGTKIAWILDNVDGARARADKGELAFGTIDSFLMWRLTSGRVHATDSTNAGRTLLFNIHENRWDDELCALLDVPRSLLPAVHDSAADFCTTDKSILGVELPVAGVAGDQHAASIGQVCFQPGMVKNAWLTQYLANVLNIAIERPRQTETTALGAAYLAGLQCGVYQSLDDLTANWQQEHEFRPAMDSELRKRVTAGWADAVRRTRSDF